MKKTLAFIGAIGMTCIMATAAFAAEPVQMADGITGGWTTQKADGISYLSSEQKEIIDKALEGYTGLNINPIAVIATQVVAGTNYAYLCETTAVTPEAQPKYSIVKVYADLNGNAEITDITDINVAAYNDAETTDAPEQGLAGGWTVTSEEFESAVKEELGYAGVELKPYVCLATQVVAGTNYAYLCRATAATEEPYNYNVIAFVYEDTEGNKEVTKVVPFDVANILGASEDYSEYIGYQFAGKDPWGGELSVTLRTLENGQLTFTYTDVVNGIVVYAEVGPVEFKDGKAEFTAQGITSSAPIETADGQTIETSDSDFSYKGTLEIKDGKVIITLTEGAMVSKSEAGGGAAYQVGPLDDTARVIELEKCEDNA